MYKKLYKIKEALYRSKYRPLILFALFVLISILYIRLLNFLSVSDYINILPALGICIILLLVIIFTSFFDDTARGWIEKHQGYANTLLVLFTLIVTFSIYYVDQSTTFYRINTGLVSTNYTNLKYATEIIKDTNKEWIYWSYFLTSPYEQNLSFIGKNFPRHECSNKYLNVISGMQILNEVNRNINQNASWLVYGNPELIAGHNRMFQTRKDELTDRAKGIQAALTEILVRCHSINVSYVENMLK